MTPLTEERLARALNQAVPDVPDAAAGRLAAVRRRARRLQTRRRVGGTAAVLALAAAVGYPATTGLLRAEPAVPAGPRPKASSTPAQTPPGDPQAVLAALRGRPLSLPALAPGQQCPVSPTRQFPGGGGFSGRFSAVGPGPLYVAGASPLAFDRPSRRSATTRARWLEQKVIWVVAPEYPGPLLLRGAQLDGTGGLRFYRYVGASGYTQGAGSGPYRELAYLDRNPNDAGSLRTYPSGVFVRGPGCYAVQVDGLNFTETLVFEAVVQGRG